VAFKTIPKGEVTFLKPKDMEPGQTITGRYLEARKDQFGGFGYKVRTEDHGTIVINGCGSLDYQMEQIQPGHLVQITFTGKEKLKSGKWKGTEAYQFEVAVDEDDFEAVPASEAPAAAGKVGKVTG
jgi:hypothetical protein